MCTTRWQTRIAGRGGMEEEYLCCSRRISWLHARMLILNWLQTLLRDEASERASCMDMHMQDSCSHRARMSLPPPSFPLSVGTLQARTHFDGMTNVDRLLAADLNCRSRWETPSVSPASPARSVATRNHFPPTRSGEPPTIWLTLCTAYERVANGFNCATSFMGVRVCVWVSVCARILSPSAVLWFASISVR